MQRNASYKPHISVVLVPDEKARREMARSELDALSKNYAYLVDRGQLPLTILRWSGAYAVAAMNLALLKKIRAKTLTSLTARIGLLLKDGHDNLENFEEKEEEYKAWLKTINKIRDNPAGKVEQMTLCLRNLRRQGCKYPSDRNQKPEPVAPKPRASKQRPAPKAASKLKVVKKQRQGGKGRTEVLFSNRPRSAAG